MIKDIPAFEEFFDSGRGLLDVAWSNVFELLQAFQDGLHDGQDDNEEYRSDFWSASQRRLSTSLTIIHQGVEFLLKGRIASVSSLLLLSDPPDKLRADGIFSDHKTIDAKDLVNLHNAVCEKKLSEEFVTQFNSFRKKRNTIAHSVSTGLTIDATDMLRMILFFHKEMFPAESWSRVRRQFVETAPETVAYASDYVVNKLCNEFNIVIHALKPADVKQYFHIKKSDRRYYCPECHRNANHDVDFEYKLAVERPTHAASSTLYCLVCDKEMAVISKQCQQSNCKGRLVGTGRCHEICLQCGCAISD